MNVGRRVGRVRTALAVWVSALFVAWAPEMALENRPKPEGLREYRIPGAGVLVLPVPREWEDNAIPIETPAALNLAYRLRGADHFYMKITAVVIRPPSEMATYAGRVRGVVEAAAGDAAPQSVEGKVEIRELKGAQLHGYYFSATDKNEQLPPGEFRYMTQGSATIGELAVIFTIFSNMKNSAASSLGLSLIEKASYAQSAPAT